MKDRGRGVRMIIEANIGREKSSSFEYFIWWSFNRLCEILQVGKDLKVGDSARAERSNKTRSPL